METGRAEIAVIGGGVIGLACALLLASEGREVALVEPGEPGMGASWGNAGTVADYAVQPVGTPAVLRNLPSLLLDRDSPLAIRRAAVFSLAPWLLRFAWQSLPGRARANAAAIAALASGAGPLWRNLAAAAGAADILQHRGCLYVYETARAARAAEADMAFRRSLGVSVELIGAGALAAMEPGLPEAAGAAYFPDAMFMNDPGRMMRRLAAAAFAAGVRHVPARVEGLVREKGGVTLTGPGLRLEARRAVIAAGAHSRGLARQAGDRAPLDTERGYHLEFDIAPPLTRPASFTTRGFYLCPMAGRLRVAGTVELGGLRAPPSPHRLARLEAGARAILPGLPPPAREWMGFRPSLPDSLPVIGPSRAGPEVIHAYGHGHIGLTLAPVTARMVADLVAGRAPEAAMAACLPTRF